MPDFIYLFRSTPAGQREAMGTPEAAQRSLQRWMTWIRELEANGHLKDPGQPLGPEGKVVGGRANTITDGPYAEAKDIVLGFLVVEARDMAEAAEIARGCPIAQGGGTVEVRPVMTLNV
jgi:hypothetical protein